MTAAVMRDRRTRRRAFVERQITHARADQQRCLDQVLNSLTDPQFRSEDEVDLAPVTDTFARAARARLVIDGYLDEWAALR